VVVKAEAGVALGVEVVGGVGIVGEAGVGRAVGVGGRMRRRSGYP